MKYEVILFDADRTLFDFDKAEANALEKTFDYFHFEYNEKQLRNYRIINNEIWIDYEKGKINSQNLRIERFKRLFENLEKEVNVSSFSSIYLSILARGTFLIDGAEDICKYISKKCKIVILTNGLKDVQIPRIKNSVLNTYIDDVIVSEEIGYKKPSAEIFNYTFNKIGHVNKKTALMVGDSLTADIQGGINYKIDTCWFNKFQEENRTKLIPDYEIKDLKELIELL